MISRFWERWQTGIIFLLGALSGAITHALLSNKVQIDVKWDQIPIADLVTALVAVAALLTAPSLFSRLERRDVFDRRALSMHLEPARVAALSVPETLLRLNSDVLSLRDREELVSAIRVVRSNLEHVKRIAVQWEWPPRFITQISNAQQLATSLNIVATGNHPYSKRARANQLARELDDALLVLLRLCAT